MTAVDTSPLGLEKAQKLTAERTVVLDTLVVDLADFVIQPGEWDAIVSISSLNSWYEQIYNLNAPAGRLLRAIADL